MANEILKVQKLANSSAKAIQKMVNDANKKALEFNAKEAAKAREFNSKEAATARNFNANESAISRAFNASEAARTREFNMLEAEKSRSWQKEMSDTAHQREVEDLKKAGLNPVLSAGAGAQSYTTSSASAGAASSSPASAGAASVGAASGSVESGAGAIGSLMSGMLGAMTGLETARMQRDTTLRASQIAANASRYVADQNLKASKYAADSSYASSKYSSDVGYSKEMDKPQGSPFALIDKYFGKSNGNVTASTGEYLKGAKNLSPQHISSGYKLTASDKRHIDIGLSKLHIPINAKLDGKYVSRNIQRKLYVDAFKFGDKKSLKLMYKLQAQNGWNPYDGDKYYNDLVHNYQ